MNDFFLNLGFSWTWSKILPYVMCVILGVVIFFLVKSRIKRKKAWVKVVSSLVIVIPFGLYFAFNPIYEGDFSNDYRNVKAGPSFGFTKDELTVLVIPNCPFCSGAFDRVNKIVERTHGKRVNIFVITDQEEALVNYKKLASKEITVQAISDFDRFNPISMGRFPTFAYSDGRTLKVWHNDGFGVGAIDWVEEQLVN